MISRMRRGSINPCSRTRIPCWIKFSALSKLISMHDSYNVGCSHRAFTARLCLFVSVFLASLTTLTTMYSFIMFRSGKGQPLTTPEAQLGLREPRLLLHIMYSRFYLPSYFVTQKNRIYLVVRERLPEYIQRFALIRLVQLYHLSSHTTAILHSNPTTCISQLLIYLGHNVTQQWTLLSELQNWSWISGQPTHLNFLQYSNANANANAYQYQYSGYSPYPQGYQHNSTSTPSYSSCPRSTAMMPTGSQDSSGSSDSTYSANTYPSSYNVSPAAYSPTETYGYSTSQVGDLAPSHGQYHPTAQPTSSTYTSAQQSKYVSSLHHHHQHRPPSPPLSLARPFQEPSILSHIPYLPLLPPTDPSPPPRPAPRSPRHLSAFSRVAHANSPAPTISTAT